MEAGGLVGSPDIDTFPLTQVRVDQCNAFSLFGCLVEVLPVGSGAEALGRRREMEIAEAEAGHRGAAVGAGDQESVFEEEPRRGEFPPRDEVMALMM